MSSEVEYWKREAQKYKAALRQLTEVAVAANAMLLKEVSMTIELVAKPADKSSKKEVAV